MKCFEFEMTLTQGVIRSRQRFLLDRRLSVRSIYGKSTRYFNAHSMNYSVFSQRRPLEPQRRMRKKAYQNLQFFAGKGLQRTRLRDYE